MEMVEDGEGGCDGDGNASSSIIIEASERRMVFGFPSPISVIIKVYLLEHLHPRPLRQDFT
jgi:hypothetical protein